ncbi:MAG: hypothetical protein JWM40_1933 [Frankiales bacterium]|nr:hypothetical protein [Frankiales bacterium]
MTASPRQMTAFASLVLVAVISAGCSGAPKANGAAGTTATGGSSSTTSTREKAVKFSECMRESGVSAFPDPDPSGSLTIDAVANGSSIDTSSAAWKAALSACQDLQPPGFTGTGRTAQQQKAALKFAQCVRDNGVKDFPDPTPDSPLVDTTHIPSTQNGDLSALNAAMHACSNFATDAGVKAQ